MISIRKEIAAIENGKADKLDNVLKNAPHTMDEVTADAVEPRLQPRAGRLPQRAPTRLEILEVREPRDMPYGDRNLVCTCPPIEAYEEQHA
jgi:glycine dehydrogenase